MSRGGHAIWGYTRAMSRRTIFSFAVGTVAGFCMCFGVALADTGSAVTSLSVNPSVVGTGLLANLSWTLASSTGYSLYFTCPSGVTVFNDQGTSVSCNTRVPFTSAGSGSAGYSFVNVTGTPQRMYITMYPKDNNGIDVDAGSTQTSLSVNSAINPITDLTVSTTTLSSGSALTVTWQSHYIPAVNMRFDCSNDLVITSSLSTNPIVCGGMAFSSDQSASGSQTVTVVNRSLFPSTLSITMLPTIIAGLYDGTNSKMVTLSVSGAIAQTDPAASSFTASSTNALSGATTTLTWATANAKGINLQIVCTDDITVYDGTNTAVPCGRPAFSAAITAASTTALRIVNSGTSRRLLKISLLLMRADGSYVVASGKDLSLLVLLPGETAAILQSTTPTQGSSIIPSTLLTGSLPQTGGKAHAPITLVLSRGTRSSQVTILQTFLSLDHSIYPEASVTGLFGPATYAAVKRFQMRYGIAKQGDSGYGLVGPGTRAKINALVRP